jgi:hypothetical protein
MRMGLQAKLKLHGCKDVNWSKCHEGPAGLLGGK